MLHIEPFEPVAQCTARSIIRSGFVGEIFISMAYSSISFLETRMQDTFAIPGQFFMDLTSLPSIKAANRAQQPTPNPPVDSFHRLYYIAKMWVLS